MKKSYYLSLIIILLFFYPKLIQCQNDTLCEYGTRWEDGGTWNAIGPPNFGENPLVDSCANPDVNAGPDQTLCNLTTTTVTGSPSGGTWSTSDGSATIDSSTGAISSLSIGVCQNFTYTVVNDECNDNDVVQICVDAQPDVNAGPDQILCNVSTVIVKGFPGGGIWSAGSGSATINATIGAVSGMTVGNCYIFTYSVVNGECSDSDEVEICVNELAIAEINVINTTVCEFDLIALDVQTNGSGFWSVLNGSGAFDPENTNPSVDYIPVAEEVGTLLQFVWTTDDPDGTGPCPATSDTVEVGINPIPMVSTFAVGDTVCAPDIDSLEIFPGIDLEAILSGSATSGTWSGGLGTINFPNSPDQATYIPDPSEVNTNVTLYWTTNDPDGLGPCEAAIDSVDIYIEDGGIVGEVIVTNSAECGLIGDDCNGSITFILLSGPLPGFYEVRFISGTIDTTAIVSGSASPPATVTLSGLCTGGYFIVSVTPPNGCTDIINSFVTINDPSGPQAPIPTATTPVCVGQDIQLFANIDLPPGSYFWEGPNGYVSFSQNPVIPDSNSDNIGLYTLTIISGGCESAPGVILVELFSAPSSFSAELVECENTPRSGEGIFDLTEADDDVQGVITTANTVNYYLTETDALFDQNPLSSPYTSSSDTIYASVESDEGCLAIAEVILSVNPFVEIGPVEIIRVCEGNHLYVINPDDPPNPLANNDDLVYYWYLDGVLIATIVGIPYYSPSEIGVYIVEVLNYGNDECSLRSSTSLPFEINEIINCTNCTK